MRQIRGVPIIQDATKSFDEEDICKSFQCVDRPSDVRDKFAAAKRYDTQTRSTEGNQGESGVHNNTKSSNGCKRSDEVCPPFDVETEFGLVKRKKTVSRGGKIRWCGSQRNANG